MIEGVMVTPLKQIVDERGKIMHMLRCDSPHFRKFGEIYFSFVHPGIVKGWHLHREMVLNYAVPYGKIKLVLYDGREDSKTGGEIMELFLGPDDYRLVTVPPGIWNGFKGLGTGDSIIANCSTIPHDPDEILRKNPYNNDIPYDWDVKEG